MLTSEVNWERSVEKPSGIECDEEREKEEGKKTKLHAVILPNDIIRISLNFLSF